MDGFDKLGYDNLMRNNKMKTFTFSIYASDEIHIEVKNSLREN